MSTEPPPIPNPIIEIADFFARGPSPEEIAHFDLSEATHEYISGLLEKEDDGTLTAEERHLLDQLLIANEVVMLIRSRATHPIDTPPPR